MKKTTYLILIAAAGLVSCVESRHDCPAGESPREIEISISTSGQPQSRSDNPIPDAGGGRESDIADLDLLVFDENEKYLYRREAIAVQGEQNKYRASLLETNETLTIHLLANCRDLIQTTTLQEPASWEDLRKKLIDENPKRLVGEGQLLPMWGRADCALSDNQAPTKLGTVEMQRSVASVDLYVEKKDNFKLTGLYLYYAPNKGCVGSEGEFETLLIPGDMETSLNKLYAYKIGDHKEGVVEYKTIVRQMYLYENNATTTGDDLHRPTRLIMEGHYNGSGNISYYPIDIVGKDGKYIPVRRNWKYKFVVTSVEGPGSQNVEDAAKAAQTDLNVNVIEWNRVDVEIGVTGKYYVSMERKAAYLWRDAGSKDRLKLTYRIEDSGSDAFAINFRDAANGSQTEDGNVIENNYFRVTMKKEGSAAEGTVTFTVEALKDYNADHCTDYVEISFRNLRFGFTITQRNSTPEDWEDGGVIPAIF